MDGVSKFENDELSLLPDDFSPTRKGFFPLVFIGLLLSGHMLTTIVRQLTRTPARFSMTRIAIGFIMSSGRIIPASWEVAFIL